MSIDPNEVTIKDEAEADKLMDESWGAMAGTPEFLKYKQLVKDNFKKNVALAQMGLQLSDLSMVYTRLEVFIEFAFPKGEQDRLEFETKWQEEIKDAQEQMHAEYLKRQRDQQIAEGLITPPKPRLFVPGR